nr:acetyl-coenzyme A synthetase N-terminal domain-containing protein [Chitinophagales bacterium]
MQYPYQIDSAEAYQKAWQKSVEEPEQFWSDIAGEFVWKKRWDKVLDWNFREPKISWFAGGRLNITENCLDRHLEERGDQPAIIWEPNDPAEHHRILTYRQ